MEETLPGRKNAETKKPQRAENNPSPGIFFQPVGANSFFWFPAKEVIINSYEYDYTTFLDDYNKFYRKANPFIYFCMNLNAGDEESQFSQLSHCSAVSRCATASVKSVKEPR